MQCESSQNNGSGGNDIGKELTRLVAVQSHLLGTCLKLEPRGFLSFSSPKQLHNQNLRLFLPCTHHSHLYTLHLLYNHGTLEHYQQAWSVCSCFAYAQRVRSCFVYAKPLGSRCANMSSQAKEDLKKE